MTGITWVESDEGKFRCTSRRGPKSTIRCEVHEGHNDSHAGRDRAGRWYFWSGDGA